MGYSAYKLPARVERSLDVVEGWIRLENYGEALKEIEEIPSQFKTHYDVLDHRCEMYRKMSKWDLALPIAESLCRHSPKLVIGWIHRGSCLHHLGRTEEAMKLFESARNRFPLNASIRYRLAVFAALAGEFYRGTFFSH
jgi:tetratricopeptide (TPR) repeat protein